jgi:hypothetical protein
LSLLLYSTTLLLAPALRLQHKRGCRRLLKHLPMDYILQSPTTVFPHTALCVCLASAAQARVSAAAEAPAHGLSLLLLLA